MTLKEQIQTDLVQAYKEKNTVAKTAIGCLKAAITEAEKANKNTELDDMGVIKLVTKIVKNYENSIAFCNENGRSDIAQKDEAEVVYVKKYMPTQMGEAEIKSKIQAIFEGLTNMPNEQAKRGKALGEFNKLYNGRADLDVVKRIINEL